MRSCWFLSFLCIKSIVLLVGCSSQKELPRPVSLPAPSPAKAEPVTKPVAEETTTASKEPSVVTRAYEKNLDDIAKATRAVGGHYKVGKPFKINGVWYFPKEEWSYDEVGSASWYGDDFHGKRTANGEIFDKNKITAAHRTLPLPCIVRVTNLENGMSLLVRVNDRGPFAKERILDLSYAAARALRFDRYGDAHVRVQILSEESQRLKEKLTGKKRTTTVGPSAVEAQEEEGYAKKVKGFFQKLIAPSEEAKEVGQASGKAKTVLQLAAFHIEDDAKRLVYKIKNYDNLPVYIKEERRKSNVIMYCVQVGPIADKNAQSTLNMLKKKYKVSGAYVLKG